MDLSDKVLGDWVDKNCHPQTLAFTITPSGYHQVLNDFGKSGQLTATSSGYANANANTNTNDQRPMANGEPAIC
ncbi:MAG: hypothetical protein ABJZ55_25770 [Fuerstiella sp.]